MYYYFYITVRLSMYSNLTRDTKKKVWAKDKHTAALIASYRYNRNIGEEDLFTE